MIQGSPWLHERIRTRPSVRLFQSEVTDVCIVGGGIAGIATAYEVLLNTPHRVVLLESSEVGTGATGNNAGQMVTHFERSTPSLVSEYGEGMTKRALKEVDAAWDLLAEMVKNLNLETPIHPYSGATGYKDMESFVVKLEEVFCDVGLSRDIPHITVLQELLHTLPKEYLSFVTVNTLDELKDTLHMNDDGFIAAIRWRGAVCNSGSLVEEMANTLIKKFPMRFSLYEQSPVDRILLNRRGARVFSRNYVIDTKEVVLATNGSESFALETVHGSSLNALFHHDMKGAVGYMAGYLVDDPHEAMAHIYFGVLEDPQKSKRYDGQKYQHPYVYLTRRPYRGKTLIALGGPEDWLEDTRGYTPHAPYPEHAKREIRDAVDAYRIPIQQEPDFLWHGLMGYTQSGVRVVGKDPRHASLWYNLGCNGIGLLPTIMGARRISQLLRGRVLPASIFDPR